MKQILLATTALVMTAGVAAAEISFSGSAEMGVIGGGDNATERGGHIGGGTEFHNDFNLIVTATGESDTGLSFGVSVEISKDEGNSNGNFSADNEAAFISGAFGTLTMGEIDGAMDWAITENVGNPGTIADDETEHAGYMGAFGDGNYDNQIARYEYNFGDFGVAVSAELADESTFGDDLDNGYAVGAKYSADMGGMNLGFGLGYQQFETSGNWEPGNLGDFGYGIGAGIDMELIGVSANVGMDNGLVAGIAYTQFNNDIADFEHLGVSGGYTTGAFEIGANYGEFSFDDNAASDAKGWGLAAAYDLGGGLKVHGGYGDSDIDGVEGDFETYSVGVSMSF